WRFCGTSAAAPHAAAVAALLRQAKPSLSGEELREALTETADPVGSFGTDAVGGGLVNAFNALGSLPGPLVGGDGPSELVPPLEGPGTSGVQPSTPAPGTSLLKHPRKMVTTHSRTARVVFRFGSDQAGVTFRCKIDSGAFRACGTRIVHRFGLGTHTVKVAAVSSAGLADPTPAAFRFRVRHVSVG
ncbi:MAG TPA: S8 family serine peptidase, partial [Solirubrobacterales bacterium]|nr:S8 family serine peptidase [Solirubrobacterales bacterium]